MLGGFTHMSIAIVALLVESSKEMDLTIPLLVAITVATWINKIYHHENYDEHLIRLVFFVGVGFQI